MANMTLEEKIEEMRKRANSSLSSSSKSGSQLLDAYANNQSKTVSGQVNSERINDVRTIRDYEAIPTYNVLQRLFDKSKEEAYEKKNSMYDEYIQAQDRTAQRLMSEKGVSQSDLEQAYYDKYGSQNMFAFLSGDDKISYDINRLFNYGDVKAAKEKISNSGLSDKEQDLLKAYRDRLSLREKVDEAAEFADEHEILGTLGAPNKLIGSIFSTLGNVGAYLTGNPIDDEGYWNYIGKTTDAMREAASKDMGDVGKFAYNVGTSLSDMVPSLVAALATGGAAAPMVISGVTAFGDSTREGAERGLDPNNIMATSAATAAIEAALEKIPFDNLLKMSSGAGKSAVKNVVSQMLSEGGEEAATETANIIIDGIFNGDMSNYALKVSEYQKAGMTEEEARSQATKDIIGQVLYAGAAGAVSGGIMGGSVSTLSRVGGNTQTNSTNELSQLDPLNALGLQETTSEQRTGSVNVNENSQMTNPQPIENQASTEAVNVNGIDTGKATHIQSPYTGVKPEQAKSQFQRVEISQEIYDNTVTSIDTAKIDKVLHSASGIKSVVQKVYEVLFGENGEAFHIPVEGMTFEGDPYIIDVNKSSVGKLVSSGPISVEKMSVLSDIDNVLSNSEYVGSANYDNHNNKNSGVIRYDYFETPIRLNGTDYIVTFDVEVQKGTNKYRTHRVINEMNLAKATGEVENPTASEVRSNDVDTVQKTGASSGLLGSSANSIPNSSENVNSADGNAKQKEIYLANKFETVRAEIGRTSDEVLRQLEDIISAPQGALGAAQVLYEAYNEHFGDTSVNDIDYMSEENKEYFRQWIMLRPILRDFIARKGEYNGSKLARFVEKSRVGGNTQTNSTNELSQLDPLNALGLQETTSEQRTGSVNMGENAQATNPPLVENNPTNESLNELPDGVHTPEQLKVMEEYKNSSNSQIGIWAKRKRNGQKSFKYLPVATVNETVADLVQQRYGLDIRGNSVGLNASSLRHIDNEHINNDSKSIMTNEDLERIGYVLEHPDEVVLTDEVTPATKTKDNQLAPKIVIRKRIDGHYYIVEAVTDAATGQDVIVTAFIEEVGKETPEYAEMFKGAYHVPSALEDSSPLANVQNAHENSSFDNSIPNSAENVNNSAENVNQRVRGYNDMGKDVDASLMETTRNFTYWLLEKGDNVFVKKNFESRMASYLDAQGIKDLESIPADAYVLASQEALKATFKDDSALANTMSSFRQLLNRLPGHFVGDAIMPFTKTPANLAMRGIDYSPAGLINGIKTLNNAKSSVDVARGITQLGQAVTGTAAIALGYILAEAGVITGALSDDKDEAQFQKQQGQLAYSIKTPLGYFSYDWAQPASIPIILGVTLYDSWENGKDFINGLKQGGLAAVDSWLELSPLQNLSDIFGGYGSPAENVWDVLSTDLPLSFLPAQMGALAKVGDTTQRVTYDQSSGLNNIWNQAKAKIPGLSGTLPVAYDTWGNPIQRQDNAGEAVFANLINPGQFGNESTTQIDDDISALYDATGDAAVFPRKADWNYTIDGEKVYLNNEQYSEMQKIMGENAYDMAEAFINSENYNKLPDDVKVKAITEMYSFASALAKNSVLGYDIEGTDTYKKAYSVYQEKGAEGVALYYAINATKAENSDAHKVSAVNAFILSAEERGYYLSVLLGKLSKEATQAYNQGGYAAVYELYSKKTAAERIQILREKRLIEKINQMRKNANNNK